MPREVDMQIPKNKYPVIKGDIIGYTGDTGSISGPHLHFELLKDGTSIDPEPFIHNIKSVVTVSN